MENKNVLGLDLCKFKNTILIIDDKTTLLFSAVVESL